MVTEHATGPRRGAAATPDQSNLICYFQGGYVTLGEARFRIMTHAFLYGTGVFEGIRAYWNPDEKQLYALRVREHIVRLRNSSKIMLMSDVPSVDEFTRDRRGPAPQPLPGGRLLRPSVYKSTEAIGVRLHGLTTTTTSWPSRSATTSTPRRGFPTGTVSWRRTSDTSIPSRSKITGSYVNPAFSKSEAMLNGFDEAIVLTADGHVSEGSAENLFMVRDGMLITPPVTDDILEGITRAGIMEIAEVPGHPGQGALDRPVRALHRRRGLPLRHGRPGLAGRVGRPPGGRRRARRADREADQQDLLRRRAGTARPSGTG